MLLTDCEFYSYQDEIWYRTADGTTAQLSESDIDLISELSTVIQEFYPVAFEALSKLYERCKPNVLYFRYKLVRRFIACNFSNIDNSPDFVKGCFANFEYVPCPLRGECPNEGVICHPKFNSQLSASELRVLAKWFDGDSEPDIADALFISPHTVHKHIQNGYMKIGVKSRAEFVKYAIANNLFI